MRHTDSNEVATTGVRKKRFISEREVDWEFGFPAKTLQNMRVKGTGPKYRKFGKAVRYDRRELEAYIEGLPVGGAGVPASALRSA